MSELLLLEQIKQEKATNTNKVDIAEQILQKVTKEKTDLQEAKDNKAKADEFYAHLFQSLNKIGSRRVVHPRTKKFIGIKFKYKPDGYDKTIYDYVVYNKDPFELKLLENLEITFDPSDNKDCGWIDKRVKVTWLNTKY